MSVITMKLIYIEKTKKDGGKWYKPMTILNHNGESKWVLLKFDDAVNDKLFKNENQLLKVDGADIEQHLYDFKAWTDDKGKYHEPYLYIKGIKGFEKAVYKSTYTNTPIDINQDLFKLDDDETMPFDTAQGVDANNE